MKIKIIDKIEALTQNRRKKVELYGIYDILHACCTLNRVYSLVTIGCRYPIVIYICVCIRVGDIIHSACYLLPIPILPCHAMTLQSVYIIYAAAVADFFRYAFCLAVSRTWEIIK